jgi:hypothetical protein
MRQIIRASAMTLAILGVVGAAQATENQSVRALLGAPGQEMTTPQLPGWYGQVWTQEYSASKFRDSNGDDQVTPVPIQGLPAGAVSAKRGGKIEALAVVPRLTYLSEHRLGEGKLGISATLPIVDLDVMTKLTGVYAPGVPGPVKAAVNSKLGTAGAALSGATTGLGDMEIAPFIDFQDDESRLVLLAALVAPTGDYRAERAVNTGSGKFWTFRPGFLYGRAFDNGLEFGTRVTYSINTENSKTNVKSGQYVHGDFSLMYRLSDLWRLGVQGYALKQLTKDEGPGVAEDGNKAQIFAAGPALGYQSESGQWAAEMKVLPEFKVRNRPEGTTAWARLMIRLD